MFSHLWVDMMERLGLDPEVIECRWGTGADEDRMEEALRADTGHKIRAVCVVQNETTTGVYSDVARIRSVLDKLGHPALLMVDGVSSIGALEFDMDAWKVDVAVTGSQKALSIPTGLALVCASDKALGAMKTAKLKRCYYDFADMLKTNPSGSVPYTPSLPLLYGMRESVALLREEGRGNLVARHHRLAEGTRAAVRAWGLELLCKVPRWYSDALTVVEVPKHVDSNDVVRNAYAKYNLSIGVGLAKVNGKVFRIGHLGNMDEVSLLGALGGVEMAMRDAGYTDFTPGAGVGAAVAHFQGESRVLPGRAL